MQIFMHFDCKNYTSGNKPGPGGLIGV